MRCVSFSYFGFRHRIASHRHNTRHASHHVAPHRKCASKSIATPHGCSSPTTRMFVAPLLSHPRPQAPSLLSLSFSKKTPESPHQSESIPATHWIWSTLFSLRAFCSSCWICRKIFCRTGLSRWRSCHPERPPPAEDAPVFAAEECPPFSRERFPRAPRCALPRPARVPARRPFGLAELEAPLPETVPACAPPAEAPAAFPAPSPAAPLVATPVLEELKFALAPLSAPEAPRGELFAAPEAEDAPEDPPRPPASGPEPAEDPEALERAAAAALRLARPLISDLCTRGQSRSHYLARKRWRVGMMLCAGRRPLVSPSPKLLVCAVEEQRRCRGIVGGGGDEWMNWGIGLGVLPLPAVVFKARAERRV